LCITFIRLNSFEADNLLVMQKTHWLSSSNHLPERRRVTTNFTTHEVWSWLLLVILLQCHRIRFSNRLKRDFFGRQATHYVALLVNRVFSMTKLMITWLQGLWRIFVDFSLARFETMALLFIAAACSWRNHTKSGTAQMKLYEKEDQEFQEFLRPSDKNREWRWKCGLLHRVFKSLNTPLPLAFSKYGSLIGGLSNISLAKTLEKCHKLLTRSQLPF